MDGIAWAQGIGGAGGGPSPLVNLLPIVLMFVILYFLMIRPQQKRAREHATMVQNLKRGDEIVTSGGIHGRIHAIADKIITVEIAQNVRIRVDRDQVTTVLRGGRSDEKDKEKA
ncbi:MAG: preprotein translocase subunit YajC [Myxococcales bacterium]|jgi:preprotein translocase subunit YajC|nr:preprotein translocase subunit YajC [Myxococcales bacterium]